MTGKFDNLSEYFTLTELEQDERYYYAYKTVDRNYKNSIHTDDKIITYKIGKSYTEKDIDCDVDNDCGAGINVAPLQWCLYENQGRILMVRIPKKNNEIIVPKKSDGKFRVKKLTVVREIKL